MVPNPIRLFHITAIDNLESICQSGSLVCKNQCGKPGVNYQNIAHSGAQGARSLTQVPNPPGGTVHDYVPFYFAPRSPMLLAIHSGRVAGCSYRQEDILHFETTVPSVLQHSQEVVFFDLNATLRWSTAYTDVSEIPNRVAWDLICDSPRLDGYCKYFQNRPAVDAHVDRMEKRMAEFLVKTSIPLAAMTRIGVVNAEKAAVVSAILDQYNLAVAVDILPDWYFLGQ